MTFDAFIGMKHGEADTNFASTVEIGPHHLNPTGNIADSRGWRQGAVRSDDEARPHVSVAAAARLGQSARSRQSGGSAGERHGLESTASIF